MKPHVKWTAIGMVVVMLIALAIYVFTNNESVVPDSGQKTPAPTNP